MSVVPPGSKISIPDDVVFRDFSGEMVLLNLATGNYFGLDAVGSRMWSLLKAHREIEPLIHELSQEYDVPEARLRSDLDTFVRQLVERGLLKVDA